MKWVVKKLIESNGQVRYYKELHGKCIIIDKIKFLIFTGNIDKHLVSDDLCDIGYMSDEKSIVSNLLLFYNHLWKESTVNQDDNVPINLSIDMMINSYNYISVKNRYSVRRLKELLDKAESIQFYWKENLSLIEITGENIRVKINISLYDNQSFEIGEDVINLVGKVSEERDLNKNGANVNLVSNLELNLLWIDRVEHQ